MNIFWYLYLWQIRVHWKHETIELIDRVSFKERNKTQKWKPKPHSNVIRRSLAIFSRLIVYTKTENAKSITLTIPFLRKTWQWRTLRNSDSVWYKLSLPIFCSFFQLDEVCPIKSHKNLQWDNIQSVRLKISMVNQWM